MFVSPSYNPRLFAARSCNTLCLVPLESPACRGRLQECMRHSRKVATQSRPRAWALVPPKAFPHETRSAFGATGRDPLSSSATTVLNLHHAALPRYRHHGGLCREERPILVHRPKTARFRKHARTPTRLPSPQPQLPCQLGRQPDVQGVGKPRLVLLLSTTPRVRDERWGGGAWPVWDDGWWREGSIAG